jgi:hypothetical protein
MELLTTFPADKLPANLSAEVLADARRRDPNYFLYKELDSL